MQFRLILHIIGHLFKAGLNKQKHPASFLKMLIPYFGLIPSRFMDGSIQFCKYCILTAGIFFSLTILAHAQTGTIKGRVLSANNSSPLVGVNVGLEGTAIGAASDEEGYFKVTNVPEGTYTLVITSIGYQKLEKKITVEAGISRPLKIRLTKTTTALNELIVKGLSESEKIELTAQAVDAVELSQTKLKTTDLGAVMAQTKGVNVRRSGGAGVRCPVFTERTHRRSDTFFPGRHSA